MASILAKNNAKVLNAEQGPNDQNEKCNCRKKEECPMPGKCQTAALIYQASVKQMKKLKHMWVSLLTTSKNDIQGTNHPSLTKKENMKQL